MVELFLVSLFTLGIVMYGQSRIAARQIRRNTRRAGCDDDRVGPSRRQV